MLPAGEFDLVYRSPLDPRSGELPVLPLSITGALAMAKPQDPAAAADGYVAADQVGSCWCVCRNCHCCLKILPRCVLPLPSIESRRANHLAGCHAHAAFG